MSSATNVASFMLGHRFTTTLSLGEILVSTHWLQVVPMSIYYRKLHIDMISLDMRDYDVIISMDCLAKYSTSIDCYRRRVVFQPDGEKALSFWVSPRKRIKSYYWL